jgi:3-phosphoshikimate 1-carboxyvinyltransferase
MDSIIEKSQLRSGEAIQITGSKSESNRLLLLQALNPYLHILNLSKSDDTRLMQSALQSDSDIIDVHHAGTAMRFLTAYFAIQNGRVVTLTGSKRMKERPIKILVDALRHLGAQIEYLEKQGFPPLKITGKPLLTNEVSLKANVSSQYISALLLIGSELEHGLTLHLEGTITSVPYIEMTLSLLKEVGIASKFSANTITVASQKKQHLEHNLVVESDWSSASYYYSCIALSPLGTELTLSSYKKHSLQGDAVLSEIYEDFGVTTNFSGTEITLIKSSAHHSEELNLDLRNAPDIAQTIVVTAFGLGMSCHLTGLHTLKIKETDRLIALKTELQKLGAKISVTEDSLRLDQRQGLNEDVTIRTYNDHRMAMAFAPLALKAPIRIEDSEVVSKSYPTFWDDLQSLGFQVK